jgi:xanthine dehydrogenase YagR molybdenum-binding subunit
VSVVGRDTERVDARLKVTGRATYAAEVAVANVAHAVIVGSAIARGRLTSVETRAARRRPGVLAVLTPETAPRLPGAAPKPGATNDRVLQLLQDDSIVYADQPIAVVVADTLEHAQDAAALVTATYAAETPVVHLAADLGSAYLPAKAGPRGEPTSLRGDPDTALATAFARVDATYTTPVHTHNPMEPHATIAVWQGDDHLTVYDATQGIFGVRGRVAALFGLPPANVRVISRFLGGGFGCKGAPWSHVPLAVMAAKVVGRPVKLALTRPQMFALVGHRPETRQAIVLGADRTGRLVGVRHDVVSETSRFDEFVEPSALQTRMLYACANVATSHRLVRIDVPTPTFTRAPGEASGTFALESAMDELAYAASLDPLELRRRNHADVDPESGKPWSSKSLLACYERGAARFGWRDRTAAPRSMRRGRSLVGWGMATATYPARQLAATAIARIRKDGTLLVQAGTQDLGTGTYTIMTQLAADELGLPVEAVTFELGDTELPETPLSAGSFTASSTGSAVKLACAALRQNLVQAVIADAASPLHGLSAGDVVAEGGALVRRQQSKVRDPLGAIVARSGAAEITAKHTSEPAKDRDQHSTHAFGADFVEVLVDEDLGRVQVSRVVGAFACGRILNPRTARNQLAGGIVWAIGMALTETTARDPRSARAVTRDLADYHLPTHADVPDLDVVLVDEVDPYVNAIGAKGLGEIGATGAAAAIANAVYHATGERIRDLPITPDKLLRTG